MNSKSYLHILLSFALTAMPFAENAYADDCDDAASSIIKDCNDAIQNSINNSTNGTNALGALGGMNGGSSTLNSASSLTAGQITAAKTRCTDDKTKCENLSCTSSSKSARSKECSQKIETALGTLNGQLGAANTAAAQAGAANTASTGQTGQNSMGGMGSMMSSLMPLAAVGAMAAIMMNQKKSATGDESMYAQTSDYSTLQPDGSLNCSMSDSYNYPGCDSYNAQACAVQTVAAGGVVTYPTTTVNCSAFSARYCASSATGANEYMDTTASGSIVQIAIGGSGEGLGSTYCKQSTAISYCSQPAYAAQRASCPSCMALQSQLGSGCQANPSACLATNSSGTLLTNVSNSCQDDPMYVTPSNSFASNTLATNSASATVTTVTTASANRPGAVNGAVGGKATGASVAAGAAPAANAASGGSLQSIVGLAAKSIAAGNSKSGMVNTNAGAGKASDAAAVAATKSALVGRGSALASASSAISRDVASANAKSGLNTVAGIKTASAESGPTSDISGAFGPSLFSTSSNAIKSRCQAGKLYNCP